MIIKIPGTGSKGRFVFRGLVSYVARQAGVSRISVGGGLSPDGSTKTWISEMESRLAGVTNERIAMHVIASLTHHEVGILGQDGLQNLMRDITAELKLEQQQRIGAVHVDATHLHMHEIYSLIRADGSVVSVHADQPALRRLARRYEEKIGVTQTPAHSPVKGAAKDAESWTRLPSFASYVQIAGPAIGIEKSTSAEEYLELWARLGVWYQATEKGGVLATLHQGKIVRVKASLAGFTPAADWRIDNSQTLLSHPSGYGRLIEMAKTRLLISEPTYGVYLSERAHWRDTGAARGRATRVALREHLASFDQKSRVVSATFSGLEARAFRVGVARARAVFLKRNAEARAEIARHRPDAAYGVWLKDRARAGDVAAGLVLSRGRATADGATYPTNIDSAIRTVGPIGPTLAGAQNARRQPSDLEQIIVTQSAAAARLTTTTFPVYEASEIVRHGLSDTLTMAEGKRRFGALAELAFLGAGQIVPVMLDPKANEAQIEAALIDTLVEKRGRRLAENRTQKPALTNRLGAQTVAQIGSLDADLSHEESFGQSDAEAGTERPLFLAATGHLSAGQTITEPPRKNGNKPDISPRATWQQRLDEIDAREAENLAKIRQEKTGAGRAGAESTEVFATLVRRADVNAVEHLRSAVAGTLAAAPDRRYRFDGSRFEYDRLQRSIATLKIVDAPTAEHVSLVYVGGSILPSFYDRGTSYQFTPYTGTHTDSMKVALLVSERRWGSAKIEGNAAFMKAALEAAAELGVIVSNPELQTEWRALRDRFERQSAAQAKAFQEARRSVSSAAHAQAIFDAFGREAELLSVQHLAQAETRTVAHVTLRGIVDSQGAKLAVLENASGRLQALELTAELASLSVLAEAINEGPPGIGLAVTTGDQQPLEIALSEEVREHLLSLESARRAHAKIILDAQLTFDAEQLSRLVDRNLPYREIAAQIEANYEIETAEQEVARIAAVREREIAFAEAAEAAMLDAVRQDEETKHGGRRRPPDGREERTL